MIDYSILTKALEKNEFQAQVFETAADAMAYLMSTLDVNQEIGMGGSKTIDQIGLYERLTEAGYKVYWHWRAPKETWHEVKEHARHAPVYMCSANAVSMDGKIVNMDGASNRVSAMVYGPEHVYLLVGQNKICPDLEAAHNRIFDVVSPKIAKMVDYRTPCKTTGKCYDCNSPDRCCRVEVILHKQPREVKIHVLLIKENLGF